MIAGANQSRINVREATWYGSGRKCAEAAVQRGARGVELPSGEPSDSFVDRQRQRKRESALRGCGTVPEAPQTAA